MNILGICGSLKQTSSNLTLLQTASDRAPAESSLTIFDGIGQLPLFNPDLLDKPLPQPVLDWKQALTDADAILIACPEYGHSLPGALKNAIDWVIGSGEIYNKRTAITAAVPHPERGLKGLAALHQTLSAVDAVIVFADTIVRDDNYEHHIAAMLEVVLAS